jgi:hypothetical protein
MFPLVRAIREQVDWAVVRQRVAGQPFAETFLALAERLDIVL